MKILFTGCSHTYGAELKCPTESRYSKLVSDHFGTDDNNIAKSRASNYHLLSRATDHILKDSNYDLCFVQLTNENRIAVPSTYTIETFFMSGDNYPKNSFTKTANAMMLKLLRPQQSTLFEYNYSLICMFKYFCDAKGISTLFFFSRERYLNWYKENHDDLNVLDFTLDDIPKEHFAPRGHPNEKGHQIIYENIIHRL